VVTTALVLSIGGVLVIVVLSLLRWRRSSAAARRLEQPATNVSFETIRSALADVARRSTLAAPPTLLYNPKNAMALEVRERTKPDAVDAVVVGLDQRKLQRLDPVGFAAKLGHEISHLELAETRVEVAARRVITLHFRVFGWLVLAFLLVLGFIDRRGIGSAPPFAGFVPVFDASVFIQLSSQFAALILSSAIVFVYSYFFVVRREHVHDVRGSQLASTQALADNIFAPQLTSGPLVGAWSGLKSFFTLHPNPRARRRVVLERDIILLSAVLYPAIVSGLQPLTLLLTAGWRDYFGIPVDAWNLALTVAAGLLLYAVLRADLARLGLGLLLNPRRYLLLVPVYAGVAGIATQLPRFVLEFLFGSRRGFSVAAIIERIWSGFLVGGSRIALMVAAILVVLACMNALRISAIGEANARRWPLFDGVAMALVATGAFTIASLSSPAFMLAILLLSAVIVVVHAVWFAIMSHCSGCRRPRLSALILRTQCACGREALPLLRRWTTQPYDRHLDPNSK
jgi:hypothetical protein